VPFGQKEVRTLALTFSLSITVLGQGKLQGVILPQKTAMFAGIPFSQPPVGEYRWRKPRPAVPFEHDGEYYDATYHRGSCPQNCFLPSPEYVCPQEEKVIVNL